VTFHMPLHVRRTIRLVAGQCGVDRLRVFGSRARGEADVTSDIDLLVRLAPGRDLLDLVAFKQELEARLGVPVDVVEEDGLSPYLRDRVLAEARAL
jgi:uncharacterized protein